MNKINVLEKSRRQQKDEGVEYADNKGRKLGFSAFCCVVIFEIAVNSILGEPSYAITALFWTFIAAESIPRYQFTHKKAYLVCVIAGFVLAAASLLGFVSASVR